MAEPSGMPRVDPAGPVVVHGAMSLDRVKAALGSDAWVVALGSEPVASLLVTDDVDLAIAAACERLPAALVIADGSRNPTAEFAVISDEALPAWLKARGDGEFVQGSAAGLEYWIDAIRAEELRNQEDARRINREAEAASRRQLDELTAHITAIESSRSWRVARRLVAARDAFHRLLHPRRPGPR